MRGSDGEMSNRCISVNNIRSASLLFITSITICIFFWMINEQDKIKTCTELANARMVNQPKETDQPTRKNPPQVNNTQTQKNSWNYNWDKLHFQSKGQVENIGVRTVLLVRHGQYNFETGELTELGRRQANVTGRRLWELNMNYKVIIHSTMIRARQTAEIIHSHLSNLPMVSDDLIQEGGPIPPEPTVGYWALPDRTYYVDGPRLESAFRKYFHRAPTNQKDQSFEILVGHANIFKYFALRALQLPPEAWMRVFIAHASITLLHLNPDGTVTMSRLGDSGHFIPSMVTY